MIFSTAFWHRWLALYDAVKICDVVVGYAADECNRIIALWPILVY